MYSNGMSVAQDARAKAGGIASVSGWVRTLDAVESGSLKLEAPLADGLSKGSMLFALQCNVCHGLGGPRIDIIPRVRRLTRVWALRRSFKARGRGSATCRLLPATLRIVRHWRTILSVWAHGARPFLPRRHNEQARVILVNVLWSVGLGGLGWPRWLCS